ncbi:MAG: response regulator [Acidimicrobiia bacterium]
MTDLDAEAPTPHRVLIVEDHVALGEALRLAVDMDAGLECTGVAGTVAEALAMVAGEHPDVVLMDVNLPDGDGIEAAGRVKDLRPEAAVIVLTAGVEAGALLRAARAGASGFLPKDTRLRAILDGVRRAASGEPVVSPTALQTLLAAARLEGAGTPPVSSRDLSSEQQRLLGHMAEGEEMTAVAARLGISSEACRRQLGAAADALGARSALEAMATAARDGLLPR